MFVNPKLLIVSNPFFDAYIHSDLLGKLIFIGLIAISVVSWIILIHKTWLTTKAKKNSRHFYEIYLLQKSNPLSLECENAVRNKAPNPYLTIYLVLKKHTIDILNKNRRFGQNARAGVGTQQEQAVVPTPTSPSISYLSPSDVDFVDMHLMSTIASQTKYLEKNLFILSTIVSLAPFLGLLGTVWGILTTFSEMQAQTGGNTNDMVLGGLSLALATTVLGLLDAIPALVGYNYLKNSIHSLSTDMESFSTEILASVEMQYRKVET